MNDHEHDYCDKIRSLMIWYLCFRKKFRQAPGSSSSQVMILLCSITINSSMSPSNPSETQFIELWFRRYQQIITFLMQTESLTMSLLALAWFWYQESRECFLLLGASLHPHLRHNKEGAWAAGGMDPMMLVMIMMMIGDGDSGDMMMMPIL